MRRSGENVADGVNPKDFEPAPHIRSRIEIGQKKLTLDYLPKKPRFPQKWIAEQ